MSDQAEAVLDALGDATRRRILERLAAGPTPVGELAASLRTGRPGVSKHLRVLEGAGLVTHESVGTRNLYALAPAALVPLQQWLVGMWDSALTAFAEEASE
ncbi:ArsR/SmtB family transcription factor [Pseudonocardia sp. CA-107938]|uniref:ArsR/SmtB family transcription factor n=1 Tax=Pseudonocardia sp. CA-107938 TaxID=3240021 RepID=UPI003D94FF4B